MQLFVRNRVENFEVWHELFWAGIERGKQYGLTFAKMWRDTEDPNNVFFVLDIESVEQTNAFMASSESQETGEQARILDSEFYYLEEYNGNL